jgi:very-short-patch-repair endonuclease
MTKKQFDQRVKDIGLDATLKEVKGKRKNVQIYFDKKGNLKMKKLWKKKRTTGATNLLKSLDKPENQNWQTRMRRFAKQLNNNLPKSEQWFKERYLLHYPNDLDQFNVPLESRYIPDIINKNYKYVIEIDGSIHDTVEQKEIDLKKDEFYKARGYTVIRVIAYDDMSYIECIKQLFVLRKKRRYPNPEFNEYLKELGLDMSQIGML